MAPPCPNISGNPSQRGRIGNFDDAFMIQRSISTGKEYVPTSQQAPAERIFHNDPRSTILNTTPLDKKSVIIERVAGNKDKDVMFMKPWRERALRLLPFSVVASLLLNFWAMSVQFRIQKAEAPQRTRLFLSIMWIVELGFAVLPVIQQINTMFGQWRPKLRLIGENVPTVDVIITCCNEEIDVILDTVRAALQLDYPRNRYRVIVADDGASAELCASIFGMAAQFQTLYYTARVKRGPDGYKAGNLNHTLEFLENLPQGPAEFVAGLDADMIPEIRWLRAMTPHLVQDPRMAVVCPPQMRSQFLPRSPVQRLTLNKHYYNVPLNDPLWQAQRHSYRCKAFMRDMADSAWCTGSGWVIRRQALKGIGGFPTVSLTEDLLTSTLLLAAGWKSGYVAEALQYGQVPENYFAHVKQFTRWTVGLAQIGAYMGFSIRRSRIGKLTFKQRLACMEDQIIPFFSILNTASMIMMPIFLFTDFQFVYYRDLEQIKLLLRLKCIGVLSSWVNLLHTSIVSGYQACVREGSNELWMAPYYAVAIIRSIFLPSWLGGKVTGFTPTGTISGVVNERQRSLRSPLLYRLKNIMINCGTIFHLALIVLCSVGITNRVRNSLNNYGGDRRALWVNILVTAAWPPIPWFQQISACLTPLQYAIFPPDVPDREAFLDRDPVTGVAYPTAKAKEEQWSIWEARYSQLYSLVVPFVICVLISTWWI